MSTILAVLAGLLVPAAVILAPAALAHLLPEREETPADTPPWETTEPPAEPVYHRPAPAPVQPAPCPEPKPEPKPRDPRDLGFDDDFDDAIFGG